LDIKYTLLNFAVFLGYWNSTVRETGQWDDPEETRCMKVVSCNRKLCANNLLAILGSHIHADVILGCDTM
jgi:hypothetical protein